MNKLVSIVIVTYNGLSYVDTCIHSIKKNPYVHKQIIVVDNGSRDGTVTTLDKKYPDITIVSLKTNIGPAAARNEGLKQALGEYIMFLDNDTEIHADAIHEAVHMFEKDNKIGIIQCKLLFKHDPTLLDCTGEYIGQWGFLVHRIEVGEKDEGTAESDIIFSAKSAGMAIRKKVLVEVGGFDPDYFIYLEETDLAYRVWLAGYTAIFLPTSIVYHNSGTSSIILSKKDHDYNGKFHGCKNYILTLTKNLELPHVCVILPIHIALWIGLAYYSLLQKKVQPWLWIHKAILWNCINIGRTWRKRRIIQKQRIKTDDELFPLIMRKKPLSYYTNKVRYIKIGNAEGFIKK